MLNLSENPLTPRMKNFLKSENLKGFNKTQYQDDIEGKIDPSLRYLFHILKKPYNLREEKIYDKLNAQTLSRIFQNLLIDTQERSDYRHKKYDFRTVELTRLMFHISTEYLMQAQIFNNSKFLDEEIEKVAERFFILSRSVFEKEKYSGKVSEKKEKDIQEKFKELENHEYYILSNERNELIKKKESSKSCNKQLELKKQINEITKKRQKAEKDLRNEKEELYKELEDQYLHLQGYFCNRNKLSEFEHKETPHIFTQNEDENSYYF